METAKTPQPLSPFLLHCNRTDARMHPSRIGNAVPRMPEMNHQTFDFNAFVDAGKKAFAPAVKLNELSTAAFERIARQQYAFVGEMLEFSLKQLQLASSAR